MTEFNLKCFCFSKLFFISILLIGGSYAAYPPVGDINCYKGSCESVECQSVDCSFGKLMTNPSSSCGCCKLCLSYIGENEPCSLNMNNQECGPGLTCAAASKNSKSDYICVKMNTKCFEAQDEYEVRKLSGSLGMYETRPRCDDNGDFIARKCQPGGSCYCVDINNNRIFGESPPSYAATDAAMNCECSRAYQLALAGSLQSVQFPHCLPNGNYDTLQCVNQACFCISSTNQTLTSSIQPITAITELPCYNTDVHSADYYRPCEMKRLKTKFFGNSYIRQNITVLGLEQPDCSPDGFYQSILETESTLYCADPYGKKIENFEINKPDDSSMNCKCARTRFWLTNQKLAKPICCSNGNYRPIQCRGGVCFCVDDDGNQTGLEVQENNLTELQCYQLKQYPDC
ncbi:uncharacterized protein LOC124338009 [Daphnia pulicaria]|uniref:uncharacterized protein LOC124338009 n=1 Tax=Daphnia pulicaria TaxID=35523 RepID=UPI001EEC417A|nr:uncharacterized protein LOC124338009 [Daphnia pulicaria]